jgi:hypothetical protein
MIQKFTLLILSVLATAIYGYSQGGLGTIKGTVTDIETKEAIPFCRVVLKQDGSIKGNANTDFDGKFQINSIEVGTYEVEVRNEAEQYQPYLLTGVVVSSNQIRFLDDITLGKKTSEIEEVTVIAYKIPLINKDGGASGGTVAREDIAHMAVRSATDVASTVGGVNVSETGEMSIRGGRSDASYYFIDGIKVRGSSNLPKSSIEEVSVITGGLPANYGDITGGVVSITTRGPSAKYFGSAELVSSGIYIKGKDKDGYDGKVYGLDKYGYNLAEGMFSGPLLMQKDEKGNKTKPLLGFLISANLTDQLDDRPLSGGSYRIKKDVRDELLANPLRPTASGNGTYNNSNFLTASDFENVAWRMNARQTTISGQGKIDVKTGPSMNLTFGGSMNYDKWTRYSRQNSLLNFSNFGLEQTFDWRVFGRLTQRFTNDKEGSSSKVKSAYYTLMIDYSKTNYNSYDPNHKFSIFDYGHVGSFTTTRRPSYGFDDKTASWVQNGIEEVKVDFSPSQTNSALAAITTQYFNIYEGKPTGNFENLNQIVQGNALRNGDQPKSVYDIWSNLGTPFNSFAKTENSQFRFSGSGSVNIGDHSLTLGFEYEQRADRGWTSGTTTGGGSNGPIGIWTTARQLANSHIKELDKTAATVADSGAFKFVSYNQLNSGYAYKHDGVYGGAKNEDQQSFFDYNLRKKLGMDVKGTDFIDIDKYDPSTFTLDMFSADELLNSGNSYVSYWGFDQTGKKVRGNTDINKYFNEFDENGNYKRFVGAFQPVYMSGYIMDKFAFNDLVFNVGVRVDVFNANQPVLKDPYLTFEAHTVAEAKQILVNDPSKTWLGNIPTSVGDDYTVYVNDVSNPTAINGFRKGTTWYNAQGLEVSTPKLVEGPSGIAPYLIDPNQKTPKASAFENYKPQINWMPRIAFSFPISDEASFFAHYDILTKRPTGNARFDPFNYQFMGTRSATIDNPNLKPETTIDYEIGFQQVLSKTSSLKISAFYREQRNNVQLINVLDAYPTTYKTYGNRDFGTVKGTTISYDMRRTGNMRMTAAYTLQFANGTGSDENSGDQLLTGLINAGYPNLRAIFPYSYDTRHAFAITMDYRYGEGKDYNGLVINDINVFENTGLNIVSNIYSGSPYSSQNFITNEGAFSPANAGMNGTTNGSRLPWSYKLDLQLDRTFNLEMGKDENKKKMTFLNVYIRVTNLLNQQNRINVYRATGNWNDDGYLAAAASQTSIQNQLDEQSFRDYYLMKIQNAFNISVPRTIRLGVKFDF